MSSVTFTFDSTIMGTMRQIDIVHRGLIAVELSADGTFMTPHNPCNLTRFYPLCPKNSDDVPFLTGELRIVSVHNHLGYAIILSVALAY